MKKQLSISIFRMCEDWQYNANLAHHSDGLKAYVYSYAEAIRILFEKILTDGATIDLIVYPLLYLVRHYFEIQFKVIIQLSGNNYQKNHEIQDLWNAAKKLY